MASLRNALLVGCCGYTIHGSHAFATPSPAAHPPSTGSKRRSTALHRNSPGFVGFAGDDAPSRGYGGSGGGPPINSRRPMDDPFAPSPRMQQGVRSGGPRDGGMPWEEPIPGVRVTDRRSNLSRRDSRSVNEDPRAFDLGRRFSQPPHPGAMARPHMEQETRGYDDRVQGGSRRTYQSSGGQTFVETDGRPLDVEMELWEGPNNTPTKVRMYSEDGRQRPMNILTNNYDGYGRGGTVSVKNAGPMEFPIRASVSADGDRMMGGMGGGYDDYGFGAPLRSMGDTMMAPSGIRPHGMNSPYAGDRSPRPSMSRGETVQGGSLKTFTLPSHVDAAQVTITSDGLPVNAKIELWGTSSHVKQLAEVYNDNGQTRPFAAIVDVPGGENTIAVRNTGPLEYPIQVVVEPISMGAGGGGYGPPMDDMMMDLGMAGGYGPPMGGRRLPPPPF